MMLRVIKSFADKLTAAVFLGLPAKRLEALKHDRQGQWSVRINDQWRVCFRFEVGDAFDVEITDYH